MAELSTTDRERVWRALQRYWSKNFTNYALTKAQFIAAVNATDTWIDTNQGSFNTALPSAAQSALNSTQKTILFCSVAAMRVSPGVANLLQRLLGVEAD